MVPRTGFEPVTLGLEVLCSIQLSYQGARFNGAGAESRTPITSLENWDNNRYTTPAYNRGDYTTYFCFSVIGLGISLCVPRGCSGALPGLRSHAGWCRCF